VTIPSGAAPELTVRIREVVAEAAVLSVTLTVKLNMPATPGFPEIMPDGLKVSPAGSDPAARDQL
jgi:hypothetical protein